MCSQECGVIMPQCWKSMTSGAQRQNLIFGAFNASVRGDDVVDDQSVNCADSDSGCSESSGEVGTGAGAAVSRPEDEMQRLIDLGLSQEGADRVLIAYYQTVAEIDANRARRLAKIKPSKALRSKLWRQEVLSMPDVDGYCYLRCVRWSRRRKVANRLGPFPTIATLFRELDMIDLHIPEMKATRMYLLPTSMSVDRHYHTSVQPPMRDAVDCGSFFECVATMVRSFPMINESLAAHPAWVESDHSVKTMPLLGRVGTLSEPAEVERVEDVRLPAGDPAVCLQSSMGLANTGVACAMGDSPSVDLTSSEYHNTIRMFGFFMDSGLDPGVLTGGYVPGNFDLVNSRAPEVAAVREFGAGYCYLQLFRPSTWYLAARFLGPNPLLTDVMRVMKWCGKSHYTGVAVSVTAHGFLHVTVSMDSSAVGGRQMYSRLRGYVESDSGYRIGYLPPVWCVGRWKFFEAARGDMYLCYEEGQHMGQFSTFDVRCAYYSRDPIWYIQFELFQDKSWVFGDYYFRLVDDMYWIYHYGRYSMQMPVWYVRKRIVRTRDPVYWARRECEVFAEFCAELADAKARKFG